jgi:putative two-component system response regulator
MHVAVLDDQDASLAGFAQILRRIPDVEPVCLKKAADGLHWLAGVEPAFVVVNNSLEDISGLDFIRRFRLISGREKTPIIFTSSKAGDRDLRRAVFEFDMYAYLEKPINPSEFLVYATRIIDEQRSRRDIEKRLKESAARAELQASAGVDGDASEKLINAMLDVALLHDPTIVAHHKLSSQIAVVLGREIRLDAEELQILSRATRIYDIGKAGIPQAMLQSRTPFAQVERVAVEKHCEIGLRLLGAHQSPVMQTAAAIAHAHHEHYDGSGYPRKIRGGQIPIMARIVAVSDTLSGLLRDRADRQAHTLAQAMDIVDKRSGTYYDPQIVNAIRPALKDISRIVHESLEKQAS